MPITAKPPEGGIVEQFGSKSHPLILRNGEIERFEVHHDIGIFEVLDQVIGRGTPQARHCRDLVSLGLVGGGMPDATADKVIDDLPPHQNMRLRTIALALLMAAFKPPEEGKKKVEEPDGSSGKTGSVGTKSKPKSKAQSAPD